MKNNANDLLLTYSFKKNTSFLEDSCMERKMEDVGWKLDIFGTRIFREVHREWSKKRSWLDFHLKQLFQALGVGAMGLQRPPAPIPPGLPQLLRIGSSPFGDIIVLDLLKPRQMGEDGLILPQLVPPFYQCPPFMQRHRSRKQDRSQLHSWCKQTTRPNEEFVWKESDLWQETHQLLRANPTSQAELGTMGIKVSQSWNMSVFEKGAFRD